MDFPLPVRPQIPIRSPMAAGAGQGVVPRLNGRFMAYIMGVILTTGSNWNDPPSLGGTMAVRQHVTTHELLGVVPLRYRACFLKPNKNQLWQGIVTTDLLKIYSACSYQPSKIFSCC